MSASSPKLTLVHDRDRDLGEKGVLPEDPNRQIPIEELYTRFAPYVAAIASRILGREGEVQDVVQDVFVAAVGGLRERTDPHLVRGWLAKVAVRTSMRKLRSRRFWKFFDLEESPSYDRLADPSAGPHEQQLIAEVYRALDQVTPKERVAWVLRHVEGESLEKVAELCECSLATAKRRIVKAHETVRKHLNETSPGGMRTGLYVD